MSPLVFRCSCGGEVVVPHGSPGGAEEIVAAVRRAHIDVGHHEVGLTEFRQIRAHRQVHP